MKIGKKEGQSFKIQILKTNLRTQLEQTRGLALVAMVLSGDGLFCCELNRLSLVTPSLFLFSLSHGWEHQQSSPSLGLCQDIPQTASSTIELGSQFLPLDSSGSSSSLPHTEQKPSPHDVQILGLALPSASQMSHYPSGWLPLIYLKAKLSIPNYGDPKSCLPFFMGNF